MKIFDGHGDLFSHFYKEHKKGNTNVFKGYHLDKFKKGNVTFGVFNVWIDDYSTSVYSEALGIVTAGLEELYNSDCLEMVSDYKALIKEDNEKIKFIMGLEGIDYLPRYKNIYLMHQLGARLISLTWNVSNHFAASCTTDDDYGLTSEGKNAISLMNDLGILVDVSHSSNKSIYETLSLSTKPVVASHSNVRNLCQTNRNLEDDMIIEIANKGGVIGMCAYPAFISKDKTKHNIDGLIEHIDYIKNLVGIDHIAFGFDFMDYLSNDSLSSFTKGSVYLDDLRNQGDVQSLLNRLLDKGYTNDEVEKIAHKNFLRVFNEVLK